jgi:outer membrane protein
MREQSSRGLTVATIAALVLGLAMSVHGQSLSLPPSGALDQAKGGLVRQLSVEQAVALALEQNLGLRVQRFEPQIADLSIAQVRGSWVPVLSSTISNNSSTSPVGSFLSGAQGKLTNQTFQANVGASQLLRWGGGNYSIGWDNSRAKSNSSFSSPNPAVRSNLSFSFTQPLVRNFKIDSARQQFQLSEITRQTTDLTLRQAILLTQRSVRRAYWSLAYTTAALAVTRQSLDLAQESLRNNKARVDIGTMAPIDIIEAQAEVATREEGVIVAEAAVDQAADNLRTLIFDPGSPDFWNLRLELTDKPVFQAQAVDAETAVKNALSKRTDLLQAKKSLDMSDVNILYYRNQLLPDVSLQASYGAAGQGGTEIQFGGGFPPEPIGKGSIGYGDVLSQIARNRFPTWAVGVTLSYPLGTSMADANLARARLQYSQSQIQLRDRELQVAAQVRDIARQVTTNLKRVQATGASRELSQRRLEAEQKKFAAGMSTSFLVFQAQRDLGQAQASELNAILEYNNSLVDYETIQEAPVSVASGSLVVAGTGSVSSGASTGSATTAASSSRSRGGE